MPTYKLDATPGTRIQLGEEITLTIGPTTAGRTVVRVAAPAWLRVGRVKVVKRPKRYDRLR